MGSISTGVGLISGINTAQLIDQLISLESRGKNTIQNRVSILQAQRTAMLDINARLLNLKNAARGFRINTVFESALATSSNEEVLTATATAAALPGTYQFHVKQTVANHQALSKGFANATTTPLGLSSLSFEFGNGKLARDRELATLNGGAGVRRGNIAITSTTGTKTVDLSDVTTVNEVIDRINAAGANVTASVSGDRFVITETSAGSVTVANGAGDFTATDLGIVGTAAGGTLNGTVINTIGMSTALSSLNDGNGVLIRNNVADFNLSINGGADIAINLGRVDASITAATKLADLNDGRGVKINTTDDPDFRITTHDGTIVDINLGQILDDDDEVIEEAVETVGELIARVNDQLQDELGTGDVTLSINSTTNQFVLDDNSAGAATLQVTGAGPHANQAATDLGLLALDGGAGDQDATPGQITGAIVANTVQTPAVTTLQDVADRINTQTLGAVTASIAPDGVSLSLSAGSNTIKILAGTLDGSPYGTQVSQETLENLGFFADQTAVGSITGKRLVAALDSVLVDSLNGGAGLGGATTLTLTDRQGDSVTINNLNTYTSLSTMLTAVNDAITTAGTVGITVALNANKNGLVVTDTTGATTSNLIITGDAADDLGIDTGVAGVVASTQQGDNLQLKYVSLAAKLSDLNSGRGVGAGSFRLTDGFGETANVTIGADSTTLYDVVAKINSRGLALSARVNDHGDGILIEEDLSDAGGQTPFVAMKVESLSGTAAKDLNIIGTSETITGASIEGSYEWTVEVEAGDTLNEIIGKINDAGIPVSASLINTGSGATPFRLNLSSAIGGLQGELVVDSGAIDLGLTTATAARDAKVFFGSEEIADAFLLTSGANVIKDVVQGVTIDLHKAEDELVTVTVERDTESVVTKMKEFVAAFNDVIERIDQYDFFDIETEQRGPLLGDPTTGRTRELMIRTVQARAKGVNGPYQLLSHIGVAIGKDSKLALNEQKFRDLYAADPEAVEDLMAGFDSTTTTTQEISPGITVEQSEQTFSKLGIGDTFDQVLDGLTNSIDGVFETVDENFQSLIDLNNDRIEQFDKRLEARRGQLEAQFLAMETALARLQGQSSALGSLASNINLARSFSIGGS